ncbi:hypothetical protein MIT9_P0253 [Methylomarinovum caldicuralii]|uniref:Uncharacterized protein n=1 Tax=Methylomarinovum caldicuralii TaxID=438856 RepID=A0AAU9C0U5_9GAMM|nr:hypothetical protein [Methylomarinovum caldicuralii]BCX80679.1 hypothetical protein MIT9_P0253 [Methylomarinovum caldicuralii]
MNRNPRQPHAVLDLPSRAWKAAEIERLLELAPAAEPLKFLEIGTGGGGIATYAPQTPSGGNARDRLVCWAPCDHIPKRSYPLFRAWDILSELMAEAQARKTTQA